MKKHRIIIGFAILLTIVGLSGCNQVEDTGNPEQNKFLGTWITNEEIARQDLGRTITFFSDGRVIFQSEYFGTYTITEGNYLIVNLTTNNNQTQHLFDYGFSDNNTTLRLLYQTTGRMYLYTKE